MTRSTAELARFSTPQTNSNWSSTQPRVGLESKCRSVDEHDGHHAVGAGLDRIAFIDKIAYGGLSDNGGGARDGDRSHHLVQFADSRARSLAAERSRRQSHQLSLQQ